MCMIVQDGDGSPIFYQERISTARKPYECVECERPIPVGARYQYAAGKWAEDDWPEGQKKKMRVFHTCMECFADWQRLIKIVSEHEKDQANQLLGGFLQEAVEDAFFECEALLPDDPLVQKWCPEAFRRYFDEYVKDQEYFEALGISPIYYLKKDCREEWLDSFADYRRYQSRLAYWTAQGMGFSAYLATKKWGGDLFREREEAIPVPHKDSPLQGQLAFA